MKAKCCISGVPSKLQTVSEDNIIANNIIWRTGNDGILVIEHYEKGKILLANNWKWKTTGSGEFKINGKWQSYNNFKAKVEDKGSFMKSPDFKNVAIHDFTLLDRSQCLNRELVSYNEHSILQLLRC